MLYIKARISVSKKPTLTQLHISYNMSQRLILVLGATGAQGQGVIDGLLAPTVDGQPSPYAVRALTRDPASARAQELAKKGCEVVQGEYILSSTLTV